MEKIKDLLEFYKKKGSYIELELKSKTPGKIKGKIVSSNRKFMHGNKFFIVLKNREGPEIKIFIEDIKEGSIFPLGVILE